MPRLVERPPKRVFTFGCSFTDFSWPTWANIVAHEIGVPFCNYGQGGAGNLYISNHVMQADSAFGFNQDDLVMICWSSVDREDRWTRYRGWVTNGSVYMTSVYDKKWVMDFAHPYWYAIRDYALIKSTIEFLRATGCQLHMFSMSGVEPIDTWLMFDTTPDDANKLLMLYRPYLNMIRSSMADVLLGGDLMVRVKKNHREIHRKFTDSHPHPREHLEYLEKTFDHEFSSAVRGMVYEAEALTRKMLKEICTKNNGDPTLEEWRYIQESLRSSGLWPGSHLELKKVSVGKPGGFP